MLIGGKEFSHVVLKTQGHAEVACFISCIQRNLVPFSNDAIVVNAEGFYNEFVQFKLGRQMVSKLAHCCPGLYVNGN